jgi:hypothetical protein
MTRLVVANGLVRGDMSICFSMGAVADLAVGQEGLVPLPVLRQGSPPKPLLDISAIVVQEGGATVAFRGRRRGSLAFRDEAFRFWANDFRHDIGFRRCAKAVYHV